MIMPGGFTSPEQIPMELADSGLLDGFADKL